ncbi:sucrase ferredoxin [Oryzobacter telluris]|uniref:sucrase ferredoxin n=1 Tax=Oryzobacter telluris TaxID=3149179 RepID=UPI00370D0C84
MALTDLSRCSAASRHRADPQAGSAPVASRWLLIEHQGPWSKKPLQTPPLAGPVGVEIEETAASFGAKVLLMRRPGRRDSDDDVRSWYAVDTVRRTGLRGIWRTSDDLVAAAHALGPQLSASDEDAEPMVLVCTHAMRDACCAVRGRPIVATLAKARPDEVWECTHLGGHRFAGTLLSLPDGACLGRLDPDTAVAAVAALREDVVDTQYLRGVTRWVEPVQAALIAVLGAHGPGSLDDLTPGLVDASDDGSHTTVEVLGRRSMPARTVVEVVAEALPDAPLSCGDKPKAHTAYRTELRPA